MSSSSEETIELFVIDLHKTIYIYIYISFLKSGRLFESCTSRFCKGTAGSNSAGFGEMKVLLGPWLPSDASILRNQRRHNGAVETTFILMKNNRGSVLTAGSCSLCCYLLATTSRSMVSSCLIAGFLVSISTDARSCVLLLLHRYDRRFALR